MNQSVTKYAPKGRTFSKSASLRSRVALCAGIDSIGNARYVSRVFSALGIFMTTVTLQHLSTWDKRKIRKQEHEKLPSTKKGSVPQGRNINCLSSLPQKLNLGGNTKTTGVAWQSSIQQHWRCLLHPAARNEELKPKARGVVVLVVKLGIVETARSARSVSETWRRWRRNKAKRKRMEGARKNKVRHSPDFISPYMYITF
jgi:hypothetical protein